MTADQAVSVISASMTRPANPADEVVSAVAKVFATGVGAAQHRLPAIKAAFQPAKLAEVARRFEGFGIPELKARSSIDPDTLRQTSFLHALYRPGEKIICFSRFESQGQAVWTHAAEGEPYDDRELDAFSNQREGHGAWFLANPVTGEWRNFERLVKEHNPTGLSRRAEELLTSFRYLVLESDQAEPALWIPALAQLPLPIEAVYSSGGKSIHALLRVDAENGEHWREIKRKLAPILVTLGADEGAMTAVRLTRLPFCHRAEKGDWQQLYYLNPGADETPICERPIQIQPTNH
jgi:hypothetical protein